MVIAHPCIVQRGDHPQHLQLRVNQLLDLLDAVLELCQPPVGQVIRLDWNHHSVGAGQGIDGQDRELRRTVNQNIVILPPGLPERPV